MKDPLQSFSASAATAGLSAELLQLLLKGCGAAVFYFPLAVNAEGAMILSESSDEQYWSLNMESLLGVDTVPRNREEFFARVHPADRDALSECIGRAISNGFAEDDFEYRVLWPNGEIRWLLSRFLIGRSEENYPRYIAGICFDITSRKHSENSLMQANEQLQQVQNYLHKALASSGIAIFRHRLVPARKTEAESDNAGTWSFNLAEMFGYPPGTEVTSETMVAHTLPEDLVKLEEKAYQLVAEGLSEYNLECRINRVDGALRWLLVKMSFERDHKGRVSFSTGATIDITERKQAEDRVQYLATHDGLTGLPNRVMFSSLLNHEIETAKRYAKKFAVLFIDLDRFKTINDALGHQAGDLLLQEVTQRLRHCVRASDVVARLSGDEFVVLLQDINDKQQAAAAARKIIAEVMKPTTLRAQECRVTASIGISLFPEDADDEQALMKHADTAMYQAKEEGKNNFQFYSANGKSHTLEKMSLENQLRSALENGELSLQYQAKVDLHSDHITGVEALLRWNNPQLGSISPAQFIPIAEETGLIVPIGRWVLKTACQQNMAWQRQGLPPVCIAVNLSPRQFLNEALLEHIEEALRESGMPPELLELEITEGMVMHNIEQAVQLLHAIKRIGARIAIDDFGTGYSSLAQLKRFPIDTLKVDRSFIREVTQDANDQAITEAIIAMGKSLSLTIVAEGVETLEQQNFLRNRACDEMQGYYFSRPVAAADFATLLQRHEANAC